MNTVQLFKATDGKWITNVDVTTTLQEVNVQHADIVFMHTELNFGQPNPALKRKELLGCLYNAVRDSGIRTLCVPTFTFSFCNNQEFDVERTSSRMGVLNEYIRRLPGTVRSCDPLLSVAVVGDAADLAVGLGHRSIGAGSFYDRLSREQRVLFVFFGARLGACFTYMHFLEELANVPYRYNREFTGRIVNGHGSYQDTYTLFVRYRNVLPGDGSYKYEECLRERGFLNERPLGCSAVVSVGKDPATAVYRELLSRDPNYFIAAPFNQATADSGFEAHEMVSL